MLKTGYINKVIRRLVVIVVISLLSNTFLLAAVDENLAPGNVATNDSTSLQLSKSPSPKWERELLHGRVNFNDTSLHYPKLVRAGKNVMQWYNEHLNHYDTAWVAPPVKKWKVMLKNNNWFDYYDCQPLKKLKFSFDCKTTKSIGAYVGYSGLTVGYSIDLDRFAGKRATSRKLELSLSCAKFSIDYYRMTNRGEMTLTLKGDEVGGKAKFTNFTGLERHMKGIRVYRFFNDSRYSQSAAYNCGKRQLRPAGSFMAGLNFTRQTFDIIADRVPDELKELDDEDEEELGDETIFDYTDYCVSVGYGYNFPFARNWIVNSTVFLNPGYKHARSRASSDGGENFFCLNGKVSVALAYNQKTFFVGVSGYVDGQFFNTGDYRYRSFLVDITAIAGFRF